jgi:hypothetical protein
VSVNSRLYRYPPSHFKADFTAPEQTAKHSSRSARFRRV